MKLNLSECKVQGSVYGYYVVWSVGEEFKFLYLHKDGKVHFYADIYHRELGYWDTLDEANDFIEQLMYNGVTSLEVDRTVLKNELIEIHKYFCSELNLDIPIDEFSMFCNVKNFSNISKDLLSEEPTDPSQPSPEK